MTKQDRVIWLALELKRELSEDYPGLLWQKATHKAAIFILQAAQSGSPPSRKMARQLRKAVEEISREAETEADSFEEIPLSAI